jgi:hypothetical protein
MTNITEEQMDLVVKVWNQYREEYQLWIKEHGKDIINEWNEMHEDKGYMNQEFAYFISAKFMEGR